MWLAQGKCTKILIYANSKQQATENLCVCAPKPRTGDYLTVMNVNDPEIIRLRETVAAAREEFDLAVIFTRRGSLPHTTKTCISGWASPSPRMLSTLCGS